MSEQSIDNGSRSDAAVAAEPIGLSNCDREPVQFVGAIQPQGALLVLDAMSLEIVQASENCESFLGLEWQALIGQSIAALLGDDGLPALRAQIASRDLTQSLSHVLTLPLGVCRGQSFHIFANIVDAWLLLEFEKAPGEDQSIGSRVLRDLRTALQGLQQSKSLSHLLTMAVEQIRVVSGFERVMAYRFAADGSGEVLAEARLESLESYLGLHYPASDIPEPARRLFALSPLRHLPDVDYVPVALQPMDGQPVDLSYASLRSVSTMYSGYLRNMGVKATLVMPLLKAGKLWGLISCMHHSQPLYLPYERRIPLELLSQMLSQLMESREELDQLAYRGRLDDVLQQLMLAMGTGDTLHETLMDGPVNLLSEIDADGVALIADAKLQVLGKTPSQKQLSTLQEWLAQQSADVWATDNLQGDFPDSASFSDVASGILAIRLSRKSLEWVIWFRSELLQDVHWAGDPNKPVIIDDSSGEVSLQPRRSFARWKQTVRGRSRPWLTCELDYAARLRYAIFGMIVEHAWLLAQLNAELERSNLELDAFAYASSHDMKEPLRGIHNYVEFLQMDESPRLSEKGRQRLDTILRLVERMAGLLESLLQYSRIGKNKLERETCRVDTLVRQSVKLMQDAALRDDVEIRVQENMPVIQCDRLWGSTIFQNLIANAIKYNQQTKKIVEIGCDLQSDPPVFFVRDNGIGIAEAHQTDIFDLFHRLHDRAEFGDGSGAGLTIVRRAIERHGGRIWLASQLGRGSTFYFTLSSQPRLMEGLSDGSK